MKNVVVKKFDNQILIKTGGQVSVKTITNQVLVSKGIVPNISGVGLVIDGGAFTDLAPVLIRTVDGGPF